MNMDIRRVAAVVIALTVMAGVPRAATSKDNSCPTLAQAAQMVDEHGSFISATIGGDGKQRAGENKTSVGKYAGDISFIEAYINNSKNHVSCGYSLGALGTMKILLRTDGPVKPTGGSWEKKAPLDGTALPHCPEEPSRCTFK